MWDKYFILRGIADTLSTRHKGDEGCGAGQSSELSLSFPQSSRFSCLSLFSQVAVSCYTGLSKNATKPHLPIISRKKLHRIASKPLENNTPSDKKGD